MKKGVANVLSQAYRRLNRLNPLSYIGDSRDLPSLFDIVMNAMQILRYDPGNFRAINADVLINLDRPAERQGPGEITPQSAQNMELAAPVTPGRCPKLSNR